MVFFIIEVIASSMKEKCSSTNSELLMKACLSNIHVIDEATLNVVHKAIVGDNDKYEHFTVFTFFDQLNLYTKFK